MCVYFFVVFFHTFSVSNLFIVFLFAVSLLFSFSLCLIKTTSSSSHPRFKPRLTETLVIIVAILPSRQSPQKWNDSCLTNQFKHRKKRVCFDGEQARHVWKTYTRVFNILRVLYCGSVVSIQRQHLSVIYILIVYRNYFDYGTWVGWDSFFSEHNNKFVGIVIHWFDLIEFELLCVWCYDDTHEMKIIPQSIFRAWNSYDFRVIHTQQKMIARKKRNNFSSMFVFAEFSSKETRSTREWRDFF